MALDEHAFFTKKPENRPGCYQCPRCQRSGDYSIRWVRHSKKDRLPPGADGGDRTKFDKLRDYLLRLDDAVTCKTCGKRFEIPSQHSLVFVDQLGLGGTATVTGRHAGELRWRVRDVRDWGDFVEVFAQRLDGQDDRVPGALP